MNRGTGRRRGVSPIIATILLVAIAIVLAAVLYVLVADEAKAPSSVPLGTELVAGPSHAVIVGTSSTSSYCAAKHYCYGVPIDEAGGGLTLASFHLVVATATGAPHIVTMNSAQISITTLAGGVLASSSVKKDVALEVTTWTTFAKGVSGATPLTDSNEIWIQFGDTKTSPYGQGYSLEIIGTGSYSGTVVVTLP